MPKNKHKILNGFALCGCLLAIMTFTGSCYVYLVRYINLGDPVHTWFRILFPNSILLSVLALAMCIVGLVTISKHEEYFGKFPAVLGMVLSALTLLHIGFWWLMTYMGRGFA